MPAVINVQYKAWHYLFLFIQKIPSVFNNKLIIEGLRKIEKEMLKNNEQFVDVRFGEIKSYLKQKQKEGIRIYTCPFCDKESIYFDSMEVKWVCLVCNKDYNPYDLAHKIYDLEYHPKHNPDFQIGNCGECDREETVVPEESMGGNEEKYLCLNCEREWDKSDSDSCSTCGGLFFGEKLEAGMSHQCWINLMNKD
jgi:ribosomal protein L37AE/L43A